MMFLLDANVLIRADADFYPLERIPQFWDWLIEMGNKGKIKIPLEIYKEITEGTGALVDWVTQNNVKTALLLNEKTEPAYIQHVLDTGYQAQHTDFDDGEIQKIGKDAFLVAYALAQNRRVVVTREVSKPNKQLGNRKLPDVCNDCKVKWTTDYEMYRLLNFNLKGQ